MFGTFKILSRTAGTDRRWVMQGITRGHRRDAFAAAVKFSTDNPTQEVKIERLPR